MYRPNLKSFGLPVPEIIALQLKRRRRRDRDAQGGKGMASGCPLPSRLRDLGERRKLS